MNLTGYDILSLLPLIVLAGGVVLTMLLIAVKRNHTFTFLATSIILFVSFISLFTVYSRPTSIGNVMKADGYATLLTGMILIAAVVVNIFSYINLQKVKSENNREEYYLLLMIATLGASSLAYSTHFISFFIGLETLSVSLYTLIAYNRSRENSVESGLKYLILAALSSAFLLFGMALIYGVAGSMSFEHLIKIELFENTRYMLISGLSLMIVGIGFKLAVVPFHMWTPDVYQGASAPATAFIATVSKGGVVAVVLRFFSTGNLHQYENFILILMVIAVLTMVTGNLLALLQSNIKRLLAYSSISHFGYLLVAFIAGGPAGVHASIFYLAAYFVTILGAFGMVTLISKGSTEAEELDNYKGLFWQHPGYAAAFTIFLLSLAGIPLTAGFIGKYYILVAGVFSQLWTLSIILVISSVIGLFYYLRVIVAMMKKSERKEISYDILSVVGSVTLAVLTLTVLWIGTLPEWILDLIKIIS